MQLFPKGDRCYPDKCGLEKRNCARGQHGKTRKQKIVGYGVQLREKQKVKRIYGVLESQFRNYFQSAATTPGVTGENLLRLLERRFDNVLVRLGFAASRRQARQLISHGHWLVNGRRVDIPSYQVRPDDVITIKPDANAADRRPPPHPLTRAGPPARRPGRPRSGRRRRNRPGRTRRGGGGRGVGRVLRGRPGRGRARGAPARPT